MISNLLNKIFNNKDKQIKEDELTEPIEINESTNEKPKNNNTGYPNFKKQKISYLKIKELSEYYSLTQQQLHEIFNSLGYSKKSTKRGWIATELGIKNGAKQSNFRGTDYIKWDSKIKDNIEFIQAIENLKHNKNKKVSMKEKKQKGDEYEKYIANFFRELDYFVWEHGRDKGVEDSSIDLFIKKEDYVYFVQCKNWESWKINHKEVKATRTDVREYLKKNKEFWDLIKSYKMKILYVTPKKCLTKGAYKYIEENQDIVEHQIIPIK